MEDVGRWHHFEGFAFDGELVGLCVGGGSLIDVPALFVLSRGRWVEGRVVYICGQGGGGGS